MCRRCICHLGMNVWLCAKVRSTFAARLAHRNCSPNSWAIFCKSKAVKMAARKPRYRILIALLPRELISANLISAVLILANLISANHVRGSAHHRLQTILLLVEKVACDVGL